MAGTTCSYNMELCTSLVQLSSSNIAIRDHDKIAFAMSYPKENAVSWWYQLVNSANTLLTWEEFRSSPLAEFVPADHTRRVRDKLRSVKQTSSAEKYFSVYRNVILMIGNMHEGSTMD